MPVWRMALVLLALGCSSSPPLQSTTPEPAPQTEAPNAAPSSSKQPPGGKKLIVRGREILILEAIVFSPNSTELTPEAVQSLAASAKVLVEHPEFTRIEIAGHARPEFEPEPLELSRARAERVVAELVARGVAKERLSAAGYAVHCPLDPSTEDPFNRNGRIEFKVTAVHPDGLTGVRRGCPAATEAGLAPPPVDLPSPP